MNNFNQLAEQLILLIGEWEPRLNSLDESVISERYNSQNRTIRQILGHMIDSSSNNTHRIVHLQYRENPLEFPDYANFGNNDRWISIQNYQDENWFNLIQLWKYNHLHIAHVIKHVKTGKLENIWISGKGENITLREMILDFPRHLKLHLQEIDALINNQS